MSHEDTLGLRRLRDKPHRQGARSGVELRLPTHSTSHSLALEHSALSKTGDAWLISIAFEKRNYTQSYVRCQAIYEAGSK